MPRNPEVRNEALANQAFSEGFFGTLQKVGFIDVAVGGALASAGQLADRGDVLLERERRLEERKERKKREREAMLKLMQAQRVAQ